MIAEDGVGDYATAKQKAARQAGLADMNLLPDNQEIEEALREYQGLYQKEEQPAHLRRLREIAVKVMREFDAFRPALVGSVLSGTAGQFSDVNLQIFTDDPKALTHVPAESPLPLRGRIAARCARRTHRRGAADQPRCRGRHRHDDGARLATTSGRPPGCAPPTSLRSARLADVEALLAR